MARGEREGGGELVNKRALRKYTKKTTDDLEPIWVRHGGEWTEISIAEAVELDEVEGRAVVQISAQLYALVVESSRRWYAGKVRH